MRLFFRKYTSVLCATLIFCLSFLLRYAGIDHHSLTLDEPFSVFHAQRPTGEIIRFLLSGNNAPLYELFLHYWINLGGIEESWVRLPSVIFNCITSVIIFFSVKAVSRNITLSLIAGVVFSLSSFQILFAHEARSYALFWMLLSVSLYLFILLLNRPGRKYFSLLVLFCALSVATHFIAILPVFFFFIFLLWRFRKDAQLRKILFFSGAVLIILTFPLFMAAFESLSGSAVAGTWVEKPNIDSLYDNIRKFTNAPVIAVLSLLFIVSSFFLKRNSSSERNYLLGFFLSCYLFLFFISFFIPLFIDRYVGFLSVPFLMLSIISAFDLFSGERYRHVLPLSIAVAFLMSCVFRHDPERDYRLTADVIRKLKNDNTSLIISPEWNVYALAYYLEKDAFRNYASFDAIIKSRNILSVSTVNVSDIKSQRVIYFAGAAEKSHHDKNLAVLFSRFTLLKEIPLNKKEKIFFLAAQKEMSFPVPLTVFSMVGLPR